MSKTGFFSVNETSYSLTGISEDDRYINGIQGNFEINFQKFCAAHLKPDAIAIDIGANIGVTALILSHYLPKGNIYAIEAGRKIFALLEENLSHNQIKNVQSINIAMANQSGVLNFYEDSAYGHIAIHADKPKTVSIKASSLDDLVETLKLERLDFIKIDVEGFEPQILEGAAQTLAKHQPLIYLELNSWSLMTNSKTHPIEFVKNLQRHFKYIYRMSKKLDAPLKLHEISNPETLIWDNLLANDSVDDLVLTNDANKIKMEYLHPYEKPFSLEDRLITAEQEIKGLKAELKAVYTSTSWQITNGLRQIGKFIKPRALK